MKISVLMENTAYNPEFIAEHGLSLFIETSGRRFLFDTGKSGAFSQNAAKLGIDLNDAEFAVISHGHNDHGGGLSEFLQCNRHAPVYLREDAFGPYYRAPDLYRGLDLSLAKNDRLIFTGDSFKIDPNIELMSCNGFTPLHPTYNYGLVRRSGEQIEPDPFLHEQYLMIRENGRRILISGCSHKGALNLMEWLHPDVFIGGFHFKDIVPDENGKRILEDAAEHLAAFSCEYFTGHCTGSSQYSILAPVMGQKLHSFSSGQILNI